MRRARLGFILDHSSGDCWSGWGCAAVFPLLNPDPQLIFATGVLSSAE
jgi:hypothetical protein